MLVVVSPRDVRVNHLDREAGLGRPVDRHRVARISALIEAVASAGRYEPPVDVETRAYAIVKLAEAFLFNDAAAGVRGDVDRLRDIEAALLGVRPSSG